MADPINSTPALLRKLARAALPKPSAKPGKSWDKEKEDEAETEPEGTDRPAPITGGY